MALPLFSTPWFLAALAAALVGIAKTGVPGLGVLAVPLMILAAPGARISAGWLLPLLCVADLFAVAYYRHDIKWPQLLRLFPWVGIGMAGGALALGLPDRPLRLLVACVLSVMLILRVRTLLRPYAPPTPGGLASTAGYGVTAGLATTVANAAGPVMSLYLLGKKLPKAEFMAIKAWFFLIINLSKLPIYGYRDMISAESLRFDATLLPAVVAGALVGRALFLRIPQKAFEIVVLGLTAVATVLLFVR